MAKFQRICVFLLILSLIFALAACKAEDPAPTEAPTTPENMTVYTVTDKYNGTVYTVDKENGTISDGKYTYFYEFEGNASDYKVTITYPNGTTGSWHQERNHGTGFGFQGGLGTDYTYCDNLAEAIAQGALKAPQPPEEPKEPIKFRGPRAFEQILGSLLLISLGIIFVTKPKEMARAKFSFWVRNAEPSDLAIWMYRIVGVWVTFAGVITMFL